MFDKIREGGITLGASGIDTIAGALKGFQKAKDKLVSGVSLAGDEIERSQLKIVEIKKSVEDKVATKEAIILENENAIKQANTAISHIDKILGVKEDV